MVGLTSGLQEEITKSILTRIANEKMFCECGKVLRVPDMVYCTAAVSDHITAEATACRECWKQITTEMSEEGMKELGFTIFKGQNVS